MTRANIVPFPTGTSTMLTVNNFYWIRGRFERHRRTFEIWAPSLAIAIEKANVQINLRSRFAGPYTRLVWQMGDIEMRGDDGTITTLAPCPPRPTLMP